MNGFQFDPLSTAAAPQTDYAFRGACPNGASYSDTAAYAMRPIYTTADQYGSQYPQLPNCGSNGCFGPTHGDNGLLGMLQNMFSNIKSLMAQLAGYLNGGVDQAQTAVSDAALTSWGDPHLGITGTAANGSGLNTHFDSMTGHQDLIDSDSFDGSFRISTEVTQPASNGVTYNESATITSNYGANSVTLDKDGNATIMSNGEPVSLANGQSVTLDGGETVTKNNDGSLTVVNDNGEGGNITTTLKSNGTGVDVSVQAHDVDLGGDIVNHGKTPVQRYLQHAHIAQRNGAYFPPQMAE